MTSEEIKELTDRINLVTDAQTSMVRRSLISANDGIRYVDGYLSALCDVRMLTEDARSAVFQSFCKDVL